MKFLQTFTPNEMQGFDLAFFQEEYIDKITKLGFKFQGYGHVGTEKNGAHVLIFETDNLDLTKEQLNIINEVCTQDDDSQPAGTYRLYFGILWVFIPYVA